MAKIILAVDMVLPAAVFSSGISMASGSNSKRFTVI